MDQGFLNRRPDRMRGKAEQNTMPMTLAHKRGASALRQCVNIQYQSYHYFIVAVSVKPRDHAQILADQEACGYRQGRPFLHLYLAAGTCLPFKLCCTGHLWREGAIRVGLRCYEILWADWGMWALQALHIQHTSGRQYKVHAGNWTGHAHVRWLE